MKELDSFSPTTSRDLSCKNDYDMPFDEAMIDYSFQQSIASSNDVGRSPAAAPNSTRHHPRAYNPSFLTPTCTCVTPTYDCATPTYDCATPTCTCATPTSNAQSSNPPFAPTAKLNNGADADRSFERSIVSSDAVGRSLGHHHQAYDHSPDLPNRNDKFSSQDLQDLCSSNFQHKESHEVKFELDLEAFESHLLNETSKIRDDFSCSSYSSESTEFSSCLRIEQIILDESKILDEKLNEIMNFDSHSPSSPKDPSSLELLLHCANMTMCSIQKAYLQ